MATSRTDLDELSPLSDYATELASMFVSLVSDIAVVVGQDGVVQNVAVSDAIPAPGAWVGRPWAETVTGATRRKIELLLQEVDNAGFTRKREVNLPCVGGAEIPISYSALRLGRNGPVLAVGRDLRVVAAIQQQVILAQQDMERDYWALRRDQSHQRELDQVASDAVMVINGPELQVFMANAAASGLLMGPGGEIAAPVRALLQNTLLTGKTTEVRIRLGGAGQESRLLDIFVTPFQSRGQPDDTRRLLLRARLVGAGVPLPADTCTAITDTHGRILMASDSLIALDHDPDAHGLYGKSICQLLDNPQGALAGLLTQVLRDGMAQKSAVVLGGHSHALHAGDIVATLINDGDQERIGICLRLHQASATDSLIGNLQKLITNSQTQPLAGLLEQVQTLAEQHAIGNALRSSGANLAATANALGIPVADLAQRMTRLGLDLAQYTNH